MFVLSNGAMYSLDRDAHTIRYLGGARPSRHNENVATFAALLLQADWDEPLGPMTAMMRAADRWGLSVRYAG